VESGRSLLPLANCSINLTGRCHLVHILLCYRIFQFVANGTRICFVLVLERMLRNHDPWSQASTKATIDSLLTVEVSSAVSRVAIITMINGENRVNPMLVSALHKALDHVERYH